MNAQRLTDLVFEPWVQHVFAHPIPANGVDWYFDVAADFWDGSPALTNRHLTQLFENSLPPLALFSDAQIAVGLRYLLDSGASNSVGAALDGTIDLEARLRFVRSIATMFETLIAPRVAPVLGHLDEKGAAPLNAIAYMWWDIFPAAGRSAPRPSIDPIEEAILAVMARLVVSPNPAVQESALHGLGHWAPGYPEIVARTIDRYLAQFGAIRLELANYAKAARSGCVL